MRIAGTSYTDSMVGQLNFLTARQFQLQTQVSTGQRIQKPEDDPTGMSVALRLQAQSGLVNQYSQNLASLQSTANNAAGIMQQLKSISDRAGEIATLAQDDTRTPAELQSYASEVNQMIQQAVQLANSKDGSNYLFSGTKSDTPPFAAVKDANGNVTAVTYQGNTNASQKEIAENTTVTTDTPGENTSGSGPRGLLADSRHGADFFSHLISLQKDLENVDRTAITKLDQPSLAKDEDNLIYQISITGVTLSRLDSAAQSVSTRQQALQQSLTKVAGVDVTKVITDLSQAQSTYQAALASSSVLLQMQQSVLTYL
jgi:flagellar hook-associated protein 3 FlgL